MFEFSNCDKVLECIFPHVHADCGSAQRSPVYWSTTSNDPTLAWAIF